MRWMLAVIGPLIMLLGAYVAGGTDVTCTRVAPPGARAEAVEGAAAVVASCRVRTTRWFGRSVIDEQQYTDVTGVERIFGRSGGSLQLMNGGREIAKIAGTRDHVGRTYGRLKQWFTEAERDPVKLDFSEWPFAYAAIGFGTLWVGVIALFIRSSRICP